MVDASVALRAGGGAAILVGGTLGVALPFLLGRLRDGAPWLLYTKAAAAGIILALAVVHLINHCFHEFAELTPGTLYNDFPIAGVFVVAGVYVMFLTERLSLDAMAAAEEANCEAVSGDGNAADVEAPKARQAGEESEEDAHSHEHLSALSAARSIAGQHAGHAHGGHSHAHDCSPGAVAPLAPGRGHAHAHGALALSVEAASGIATTGVAAAAARRRIMTARLLEISIVVHSFIIGLNLGTTLAETGHEAHEEEEEGHRRLLRRLLSSHEESHTEDEMMSSEPSDSLRQTVALIIVLVFHQLFEGVALGSYIYELRDAASLHSKLLMAAVFALTVPVGCWIGIGVASTYEAHTQTAIWVTGALNGVTGGMLLYSALITFMAEEFSRDDLGGAQGRTHKRRMYCCMLLGAAVMALLAIWA